MVKALLEEMNGSLVVVLPPTLVEDLQLEAGSQIDVEIHSQRLSIDRPSRRSHYRLDDLLEQSDPLAFEKTEEDMEWLNSPPVGRELI